MGGIYVTAHRRRNNREKIGGGEKSEEKASRNYRRGNDRGKIGDKLGGCFRDISWDISGEISSMREKTQKAVTARSRARSAVNRRKVTGPVISD